MLEKPPLMQSSTLTSDDPLIIYEVAGLQQNDRTVNNSYAIRSSSTVFIAVPRSRMNSEMRRITRLGGKIVNVLPANSAR